MRIRTRGRRILSLFLLLTLICQPAGIAYAEEQTSEMQDVGEENTEPQNTEPQNTEPQNTELQDAEPQDTELEIQKEEDAKQQDIQQDIQQQAEEERNTPAEELGYVPGKILIAYEENASERDIQRVVEDKDGTITETISAVSDTTTAIVDISDDMTVEKAMDEYAQDPNIKYASPDYIYEVYEGEWQEEGNAAQINDSNQIYLEQIRALNAWSEVQSVDHEKVRVVELDTGVDIHHEDLKGILNTELSKEIISDKNLTLSLAPLQGDGYVNGVNVDAALKSGHGTHVAGIIAAEAGNGTGIAGVGSGGDNSVVDLAVVDVFAETKTTYTSYIIKGLEYAKEIDAKVVNLSLGITLPTGQEKDKVLQEACSNMMNSGITIVCAAGNEGIGDNGTITTIPSDYDSTISVINIDGNYNQKSPSSNYGYLKDVSAPGVNIYSTFDQTSFGKSYDVMSGTSMATPMVTGIVAMMYSVDPAVTPEQVRDKLKSTATDIGESGFDIYTGCGLVNAEEAVKPYTTIYEKKTLQDGTYTISSQTGQERLIDISGRSTSNGGNAQMYTGNETPAQRFYLQWNGADSRGNGYYIIRNVYSGKVLDADGAGVSDGTNVQQYTFNNTGAQKWILIKNADESYTVKNEHADKVLDIAGNNPGNGVNLQLYSSNGTGAQRFYFNACRQQEIQENTVYAISNVKNKSRVIDVKNASLSSGANIQFYNENGTGAQQFFFRYDAASGYYIISNVKSGKVIDVSGADDQNGANIQQYTENGTWAQKWSLKKRGGSYVFYSACNGKCMDLTWGNTANETNIQCWDANNTDAQSWILK